MQTSNVYEWIKKEENRKQILTAIKQPLTAKQLAKRTGIPMDTCSYIIAKFKAKSLITCLNSNARNSRLFWLTEQGCQYQRKLCQDLNLSYQPISLPDVNWETYGWVCFSHRLTVLLAIKEPMQPSEIRRYIRKRFPNARISANNVRDITKLFRDKRLVRKVYQRKKVHPRYELTETGLIFQKLLLQAKTNLKL